jgi:hypothetical protein
MCWLEIWVSERKTQTVLNIIIAIIIVVVAVGGVGGSGGAGLFDGALIVQIWHEMLWWLVKKEWQVMWVEGFVVQYAWRDWGKRKTSVMIGAF